VFWPRCLLHDMLSDLECDCLALMMMKVENVLTTSQQQVARQLIGWLNCRPFPVSSSSSTLLSCHDGMLDPKCYQEVLALPC